MGACKDSLWIEGGWVSLQAYQPQEISNSTSAANLTTFYSAKREEPTPYASTSVINNKVSLRGFGQSNFIITFIIIFL
jgi:hypothetical protein